MKKKSYYIASILFLLYLVLLIWIILFKLQFSITALDRVREINLIPFYYKEEISFHATEVLENVLIFVPFGIYLCSTSTYSHYDSSIVTSRRFSPRVSTSSVFPGYVPNYNDDFESELADIFSYSCFGEGEEYIVKIKFDYIKHNTIIAFPSVIFIKAPFTVMPYTITSKNSPKVVSGEIKITEDMQHQ